MRLVDLSPRDCIEASTGALGVSFKCPCCRKVRIVVFFGPGAAKRWTKTGDTFDTMTLTPSIDTSAAGHWHGFITNGEIQ